MSDYLWDMVEALCLATFIAGVMLASVAVADKHHQAPVEHHITLR